MSVFRRGEAIGLKRRPSNMCARVPKSSFIVTRVPFPGFQHGLGQTRICGVMVGVVVRNIYSLSTSA